jgi:hypothetical protein
MPAFTEAEFAGAGAANQNTVDRNADDRDFVSIAARFDRVSIRAILTPEGELPTADLHGAGIFDQISVPVMMGDGLPDMSQGLFGDGITPNITAVLEFDDDEQAAPWEAARSAAGPNIPAPPQDERPATTQLPTAFGQQPMAPVRRRQR